MTPSAAHWFRRLAAATGVLLLGGCVVAQQVGDETGGAAPQLLLIASRAHHGHHGPHHGAHHRAHHGHHHGHHHGARAGRRMVRYTVRPGDTATGLAVRFHAWTAELLAVNHLGPHETIYVGQTLTIPVVRAAARRAARDSGRHHHLTHGHRHHAQHHGQHGHYRHGHHRHGHHRRHHFARHRHHHYARHHHHHGHHHRHHPLRHAASHHRRVRPLPDPSRATVRRTIVATAHRYGVGHNLALAIAWQESGWQMDQVSSARAVGAMQVLPSTGRWVSSLVGRHLDLRDLHDNVTAGVVLIRVLREHARVRYAVASYYQGLGSVRRDGLYRDTKRYVADVLYLRKLLRHGWDPT